MSVSIKSVVLACVGVFVAIGGWLFGDNLNQLGVTTAIPIIVIAVGLAILSGSIGLFKKYQQKFDVAKRRKSVLDELVRLYGKRYEFDVTFVKFAHGPVVAKGVVRIREGSSTGS